MNLSKFEQTKLELIKEANKAIQNAQLQKTEIESRVGAKFYSYVMICYHAYLCELLMGDIKVVSKFRNKLSELSEKVFNSELDRLEEELGLDNNDVVED